MDSHRHSRLVGTLYAVSAFILWGALPVYWKALHQVPPAVILGHRIVWTFVFTFTATLIRGHLPLLGAALRDRRRRTAVLFCALLLTANWFLYLFAVATNRLIEASLGYYINPLLSVLFGVIFLKERLGFWQVIAFLVASVGVTTLAVDYGRFPWISFLIAISFGLYGLIKKASGIDSKISITAESMVLTPFAALFLIGSLLRGGPFFLALSPVVGFLLVFSGVITALPLVWFSKAAETIPLSRVGFIQYLTPTSFLLLGVIAYHEPFFPVELISFACIWTSLVLFSLAGSRFFDRLTPGRFKKKPEGSLP
jgi:chloramphenicol-sensitive protein RarD